MPCLHSRGAIGRRCSDRLDVRADAGGHKGRPYRIGTV